MLRQLASSARLHGLQGTAASSAAARAFASSAGDAAPKSSGLRKFVLTLIPIGLIAAVAEHFARGSSTPSSQQSQQQQESGSAAAAAAAPPAATVRGGVTSSGVVIDPANPLHRVLPETDCEFCLETREKLWAMVKKTKGGAGGDGGAAKKSGDGAQGASRAGSGDGSGVAAETAAAQPGS